MPDRPATDIHFCDLSHLDRRENARVDVHLLQSVLHRKGIHDRREHTHIVGGNTIKSLSACGESAEDIAAADDEGNLDSEVVNILDLRSNAAHDIGIDSESLVAHQRFSAELEQDAFVLSGHYFCSPNAAATSPARSVDLFSRPSPVLNRENRRT